MITPIKTIWKYGIVFSNDKKELDYFIHRTEAKSYYSGVIDNIPRGVAETVAEIHPNFDKYYEQAMAVLYKTYNTVKGGSENPIFAINTLKTKKEMAMDLSFVFIWKIID
jgi:hypothetical protein